MKKLTILTLVLTAISTPAFAEDELLKSRNHNENNRRKIYLKANIGASMLGEVKDSATSIKMKPKNVPYFAFGVGTYFMDNTRVDVTINHLANPTLKKSANRSLTQFTNIPAGQFVVNNMINQAARIFSTNSLGLNLNPIFQEVLTNAFNSFKTSPTSVQNFNQLIIQAAIQNAIQRGRSVADGRNLAQRIIGVLNGLNNNPATQDLYSLLTQNFSNINISTNITHKATINSLMVNGYIDLFEFKELKFFVGAGIGAAQLKEKITITTSANFGGRNSLIIDQSGSTKKANNFAYSLIAGTSVKIKDNVNIDVTYNWSDYGKTKSCKFQGVEVGKTPYKSHTVSAGIRVDI